MSVSTGLRIIVADLLRRPGAQRAVSTDARLDDLALGAVSVPTSEPIHLELTLERIPEGIVVRGTADVWWAAECSRCLRPLRGHLRLGIDELYEPNPIDGETYRLEGDAIDLEQAVRDAVVLELPVAPRCRTDCAGLCPVCGVDRNDVTCECVEAEDDPRWAALRSLEL